MCCASSLVFFKLSPTVQARHFLSHPPFFFFFFPSLGSSPWRPRRRPRMSSPSCLGYPWRPPPPPPDEHYFFTRVIGNTTKHVCPALACRETNAYIKGWASTGSSLRSHVQTHHMALVDLMSNYLLFSGLKVCIDCTKLYTPCIGDAERCRDHRRIFRNLQ